MFQPFLSFQSYLIFFTSEATSELNSVIVSYPSDRAMWRNFISRSLGNDSVCGKTITSSGDELLGESEFLQRAQETRNITKSRRGRTSVNLFQDCITSNGFLPPI